VQIDQRVEQIEQDRAQRHARQGSRVRRIVLGDNAQVLPALPGGIADLIYIDPPFNTGRVQSRTRLRTARDPQGDRAGFGGRRYRSEVRGHSGFDDRFDDFLAFLEPRLRQAHRLLKPEGSFFLHVDYREVHYCKVALDAIFGRASFMNEIIWAYDFGGRSRRRWPAKHDNILWYARDPRSYTFRYEAIDRIPYLAPGLVGPEKAARGKTPTDVWWQTIVATGGAERTGYATQKPLALARRIVEVHSHPGDLVVDFFAGSGTVGEAAARAGRDFLLVDSSAQAVEVMRKRLAFSEPEVVIWGATPAH
jgi:site-specific DNA-methyltransferase (adenine-specific)